ncbi:unnamed protein product [Candidula unifasciata]|uniref:GOLD domain-containing protein n=1 Tax=Candidula unifasciata TaxID=100452 RepID=A0A8S3Z116_9EUPU|nr:unnamed protein product [Candidula unifasciata]
MRNWFAILRESLLLELLLFLCHVSNLDCEKILGQENEEFDFDGLPGAQHEFKVHIPGSTEDCFFQPAVKGARFHVNFEVLKGEQFIDFYIRDPQWQVLEYQNYKSSGQYSVESPEDATYAVCLHNAFSRLGSTLVYVYIVTFVMHEWVQFQQELTDVNILAANFSQTLTGVQEMVSEMRSSQAKARFHVIKDWYLVEGNNTYVQNWSLVQCILIAAAAIIQVYSVRRLFRSSNVTPTTAKPRA